MKANSLRKIAIFLGKKPWHRFADRAVGSDGADVLHRLFGGDRQLFNGCRLECL